MFDVLGMESRAVKRMLGTLYKALILGTLVSLFALAPLRGTRFQSPSRLAMAPIVELRQTDGPRKILWLDPPGIGMRVTLGQGDSLSLAAE